MNEQNQFLELLKDIADIAKVNGNTITTNEINEYFSDMELTHDQMELIYDYLCKGHIKVVGHVSLQKPVQPLDEEVNTADTHVKVETSSVHSRLYRKSVSEKQSENADEVEEWCRALVEKRATRTIRERIIENYLVVVLNIASKYANRGVQTDELIQEGSLALTLAVNNIIVEDSAVIENASEFCEKYFRECVRKSIIQLVDCEVMKDAELSAALGKAEMVNEAVKQLATNLGRVASLMELSEFTHISEEEIQDIVRFSGNTLSLGDGKEFSNLENEN